ncbi:PIN domain-containing protein [Gordonia sp. CPCC 205515]|uniref:PIN domain-containing protein n=1 Tax=Gordonia sp. CPCC 205515 TaxID=3140791 RepID=UPI003AF3B53F
MWRTQLSGVHVLISFQTRAEVIAGTQIGNWGERRVSDARDKLDLTPTIPADKEVIESYAALTAACRSDGHALHDKVHTADRWVAACAIAKRLPLLSGDGIYHDAPQLQLLRD